MESTIPTQKHETPANRLRIFDRCIKSAFALTYGSGSPLCKVLGLRDKSVSVPFVQLSLVRVAL